MFDEKSPDSPDSDFDPRKPSTRVLGTQIAIAVALGSISFLSFCILRYRWPKLYAARTARKKGIPPLPQSLFGWLIALYNITEQEILDYAGLDAFVFLGFFKASIQLLSLCTVCAVTVISPIRLHYTGKYDQGEDYDTMTLVRRSMMAILPRTTYLDGYANNGKKHKGGDGSSPEDYPPYLWVYVVFTYLFTIFAAAVMLRQTLKVLRVRQKYLGGQNSITDRTIRVAGISPRLRTEAAIKEHIENLGIGTVRSVSICRDWNKLDRLFDEREVIINKLERAWSEYLGPTWDESEHGLPTPSPSESNSSSRVSIGQRVANGVEDYESDYEDLIDTNEHSSLLLPRQSALQLGSKNRGFTRPTEREGLFGWFGPRVDVIDKYTFRLEELDAEIAEVRQQEFPATSTAFVTMDSVASAQMTAQAVLDPRPYKLIADTAPAPHDVVWRNLYMSKGEQIVRTYSITFAIAILTVASLVPITSLASFLQFDSIKKIWPALAQLLEKSEWALAFVTGILPPLLLTLFNVIMPYFYGYLSTLQGFVSHGEVELSVISKNFFYVFYNLFLFLTVAGASYWSYLKDTTQIAYELAKQMSQLSLFYVDLIILQGIGMFPLRLLQMGSVLRFPLFAAQCRTPRDYRDLYKPAIFNTGIHLPQPLSILIIVLLYSVLSTKILAFGTIYFIFGYFTYKYQLIYSMVHPQHSTGQAWPLIFRRVCVGIVLFHLAMAGILALQKAYFLATMLAPLPIMTFGYWYNFEKSTAPLLHFIALRAIETKGSAGNSVQGAQLSDNAIAEEEDSDDSNSDGFGSHTFSLVRGSLPSRSSPQWASLVRRQRSKSKTLDEQRERFQTYINPNLVRPLDGPWIGLEGDEVIFVGSEGTQRRKVRFEEWE
ncbi:Csc1p [Sugiyamaella lignohabitans]|uniref:Csc1p n=1 Tax=Sugiyamaella lignohabitans TaxID=796027 RepID=A0A167CFV7_9ASCO|nr:Csc1p [Sugiyamaella lignohabitans]ANB11635.1 Csc1p [Sugiyamaella lignohabitans]